MNVLKDGIFKITPKLELKQMQELRERIEDLYKTYQEPEVDEEGNLKNKKIKPKPHQGMDQDDDSYAKTDEYKYADVDVNLMDD